MRERFLYLLIDKSASAFKIGVSVDPVARSTILPQAIDLERSLQFEFHPGEARRAERSMHFLFRDSHYERSKCDGHTEWFALDALEDAKRFLWRYRKHLAWLGWKYLSAAKAERPKNMLSAQERARLTSKLGPDLGLAKRGDRRPMSIDRLEDSLADLAASKSSRAGNRRGRR